MTLPSLTFPDRIALAWNCQGEIRLPANQARLIGAIDARAFKAETGKRVPTWPYWLVLTPTGERMLLPMAPGFFADDEEAVGS